MKSAVRITIAVLLALMALAPAQLRVRDPLSDAETDQLREVSTEPEKKLQLYIQFARARMAIIGQLQSDPRFAPGRGKQVHDLLEDFRNIVDEIDDNLSAYAEQNADLRKALKPLIQAASEFQLKLRVMKETSARPKWAEEAREYKFVLMDATDAVNSVLDYSHELLRQQTAAHAKSDKKK